MSRLVLVLALLLSASNAFAQRLTVNFGAVPQPVYFATVPHIICDSGCGSPPASADGTAFVEAVTSLSLIGGAFNDAMADVTSGTYAASRITKQRAMHVNMRSALGVELPFSFNGVYLKVLAIQEEGAQFNVGGGYASDQIGALTTNTMMPVLPADSTAADPTYTEDRLWPLSMDLSGHLRVVLSDAQVTALTPSTITVTQTSGSNLHVVCDSGCIPTTPLDNSTFTFGTTSTTPIAFVVDDVGTNAVAENSYGAARMSTARLLYTDLSKSASNTNSFKVDFGGSAQPISAASLPLPTGAALDSSLTTLNAKDFATQTTLAAELAALTALSLKIVQNQQLMASSLSVTVASDQTALPVMVRAGLPLQPCNAVRRTNCQAKGY